MDPKASRNKDRGWKVVGYTQVGGATTTVLEGLCVEPDRVVREEVEEVT